MCVAHTREPNCFKWVLLEGVSTKEFDMTENPGTVTLMRTLLQAVAIPRLPSHLGCLDVDLTSWRGQPWMQLQSSPRFSVCISGDVWVVVFGLNICVIHPLLSCCLRYWTLLIKVMMLSIFVHPILWFDVVIPLLFIDDKLCIPLYLYTVEWDWCWIFVPWVFLVSGLVFHVKSMSWSCACWFDYCC